MSQLGVARRAALVAATALVSAPVAGCSDNEASGPLTFGSYQLVLDGQQHDPYFLVEVCAQDDTPAHVTITDVRARVVDGTQPASLDFAIAWPDGPRFEPVIGGHQPLPKAYVPAVGAEGTIGTCEKSHLSAELAVVFPHVGDQPVRVRDVTVDYEIEGHHHVGEADVLFAQCPVGEVSAADPTGGRLCRSQ